MRFFLTAKHWQLFLGLVAVFFLIGGVMISSPPDSIVPAVLELLFPPLLFGLLFCWLWAIASACHERLPDGLAASPVLMLTGLVYAFIYMIFAPYILFNPDGLIPVYAILMMHLIAMAAVFYALGFTAKQLCKLDQGKDVSFFSYSGVFFLMWFFPAGVWFVQPKVNQLLGQNQDQEKPEMKR